MKQLSLFEDNYDFLCVDGEGLAAPDGQPQEYVLLVASDGRHISDLRGLSTGRCLSFLFDLGKRDIWTFGATYDINQWLRDLRPSQLVRLSDPESHNCCRWGYDPTVKIKHLYGKMLQISRPSPFNADKRQTVRIWDMWSYVQSSFASMIKTWKLAATAQEQEEVAFIVQMKAQRADFRTADLSEMQRYTALELKYLQRAVEKLLTLVRATGYTPQAWYSPGSIAAEAMNQHGVLSYSGAGDIPTEVLQIADDAYHGGRAEVAVIGRVPGPLFHYDIRSAYPAAAVTVPMLTGGRWERTQAIDLDDPELVALCEVTWLRPNRGTKRYTASREWGPFPVRIESGSKRYPYNSLTHHWYWATEVAAARAISDIAVHSAWVFHPLSGAKPFSYLAELYRQRQVMKQPEHYNAQEWVLKLLMNSTYGKLAQHLIEGGGVPRYRNVLWAGMITAHCRAQLLNAAAAGGVLFFATDGVISNRPLTVSLGDELGQWEYEPLDWAFIVQSGIYFTSEAGQVVVKSRGIGKRTVDPAAVMAAWDAGDKTFSAPQERFIGYRSAARLGMETWRSWQRVTKEISFTLAPRRVEIGRRNGMLRTRPPDVAMPYIMDLFQDNFAEVMNFEQDLGLEQPDVYDEVEGA